MKNIIKKYGKFAVLLEKTSFKIYGKKLNLMLWEE